MKYVILSNQTHLRRQIIKFGSFKAWEDATEELKQEQQRIMAEKRLKTGT